MRRPLHLAALFCALAAPLAAQEVGPCDDRARAENIAEPWEENTATFAEGNVRVAVIDTLEPAGAPYHLMILSPPISPPGYRQCRLISQERLGWYSIDLGGLDATYDAETGLTLDVPVETYSGSAPEGRRLLVTLDQSSGRVTARESGATE